MEPEDPLPDPLPAAAAPEEASAGDTVHQVVIVERGYLGVEVVIGQIEKELFISLIRPNTISTRYDLRVGDIIVRHGSTLGETENVSRQEFLDMVHDPARPLRFAILRTG